MAIQNVQFSLQEYLNILKIPACYPQLLSLLNIYRNSFLFRKLRRVCSQCLNSDKRLKAQLVGSAPEMDEDAKSDVSEQLSQRTGSVLSDTGGLDAADGPSDPRPGTSQVLKQ